MFQKCIFHSPCLFHFEKGLQMKNKIKKIMRLGLSSILLGIILGIIYFTFWYIYGARGPFSHVLMVGTYLGGIAGTIISICFLIGNYFNVRFTYIKFLSLVLVTIFYSFSFPFISPNIISFLFLIISALFLSNFFINYHMKGN